MAVASSDLKMRYSISTAAAGDADPSASATALGKYLSTTEIASGALHNLHDVITGTENAASNAASDVEYKCFFLANTNVTDSMTTIVVWINSEVAGGAITAIGVDTTAASALTSASAQAITVADESTAPIGVTFTSPTTEGTGLVLGALAPSQCRAVWVRRTAQNTGSVANDGATLRFSGIV